MRKIFRVVVVALVGADVTIAQMPRPADWVSYGGDAQRSGWEKTDPLITKDSVKDFGLVWKAKLTAPLLPPVILGRLISFKGFKELAYVAGGSNMIWAIDADLNKMFWQRRLGSGEKPSCAGGMPAISAPVRGAQRPVLAIAGDGKLYRLNPSTGEDLQPPIDFVPPGAGASNLNVIDGIVYTTTTHACGGAPDAVWALDLNEPDPKPRSFVSTTGTFTGLGGAVLGTDGTVYVQTTGGLLALTPKTLSRKQLLPAGTGSPVIFSFKGRDIVVSATTDGRLRLSDSFQSEPVAGRLAGGLSTFEDAETGTRWVLATGKRAITAFRLEEQDGQPVLKLVWTSGDIASPEPPVVTSGVVFALSAGSHAILYALDAATGKQFFSTGDQVTAAAGAGGVSLANGRVYFPTADGTLWAFGMQIER